MPFLLGSFRGRGGWLLLTIPFARRRFVNVFFCLTIIRFTSVVEVNVHIIFEVNFHIIFDTLIVNIERIYTILYDGGSCRMRKCVSNAGLDGYVHTDHSIFTRECGR